MDLIFLHKKATKQAGKFVSSVKADQWNKISNCPDWTVRQLVNHLISENLWVPQMLLGKTIAEVGDQYEGDLTGDDPNVSYQRSADFANQAVSEEGALEKTVHLSYGDNPAKLYISHRIADVLIHGWDVAKSTGQNDELDPDLVEAVFQIMKPEAQEWRKYGILGPKIKVAEDAPLQTRLLALMGRKRT